MNYRSTKIYCRSLDLIDVSDQVMQQLPVGYGFMADQLRRAASSVTLNFAEGCGRTSPAERRRFFTIAQASAQEVASIFDVLHRFRAVRSAQRLVGQDLCDHIVAMLRRFQ